MTAPLPSTIPDDVGQRLEALPNGLGDFIENLVISRKSQAQISAALAEVDPSLVPVVDESGAHVNAGREDIDNTTNQYVSRDDALTPVENTPTTGWRSSCSGRAGSWNSMPRRRIRECALRERTSVSAG